MMIQGAKEQAKVDVQIEASCIDMELTEVELDGHSSMEDLKVSGAPHTMKSSKDLIQIDADHHLRGPHLLSGGVPRRACSHCVEFAPKYADGGGCSTSLRNTQLPFGQEEQRM
jgi:hypothetical protein